MACSKYQYVKKFEQTNLALLQSYIIVRIDGRSFTKFCTIHEFQKPNDLRAIKLMNRCAEHVCNSFKDIFLAYGQSDQYSFAIAKQSTLFSRRNDKILSCIVSAFSGAYVFYWEYYFQSTKLKQIPMFDSRVIVYPNQKCLKDYFRWRQVDCHINNLYNTVFWLMVKKGKSNTEVQNILKDTNSGQKNQILFTQFGLNYNKIQEVYRRGTLFCYRFVQKQIKNTQNDKKNQQSQMKNQQSNKKDQQNNKKNQQNNKKDKQNQMKTSQQTQTILFEGVKEQQITDKIQTIKYTKPKPKKKLIQIHQDCIKQQFWLSIIMK